MNQFKCICPYCGRENIVDEIPLAVQCVCGHTIILQSEISANNELEEAIDTGYCLLASTKRAAYDEALMLFAGLTEQCSDIRIAFGRLLAQIKMIELAPEEMSFILTKIEFGILLCGAVNDCMEAEGYLPLKEAITDFILSYRFPYTNLSFLHLESIIFTKMPASEFKGVEMLLSHGIDCHAKALLFSKPNTEGVTAYDYAYYYRRHSNLLSLLEKYDAYATGNLDVQAMRAEGELGMTSAEFARYMAEYE